MVWELLEKFALETGIAQFFADGGWKNAIMILVALLLLYLAIFRKFEPYLLLPIAFGMLLVNLPNSEVFMKNNETGEYSGLLGVLYFGVKSGIYPCLIFLGIGASTDFGPLIANPRSMLLGAAAQLGIFITFLGALALGFDAKEASSIGIIGGADGPTADFADNKIGSSFIVWNCHCAYSYMALVPVIQPPIMKLLTTKKNALLRWNNYEKYLN